MIFCEKLSKSAQFLDKVVEYIINSDKIGSDTIWISIFENFQGKIQISFTNLETQFLIPKARINYNQCS